MSEPEPSNSGKQHPGNGLDPNGIEIPLSELSFEAVHASGPGGQNINKVATAIRLTFNPAVSSILDNSSRMRLTRIAGSHLDRAGRINILARRFRSQEQNSRDAVERLMRMIESSLQEPSYRKPTRPTISSQYRRLEKKSIRKRVKQNRQRPVPGDD
jgi:ribosome-associated protein